MILFLNFAPITFGGGVERWITSVAESIKSREDVSVLQVDKPIANIYARLVFKREFDERIKVSEKTLPQKFVTWESLIPFTKSWREIKNEIKQARLIYTKLELNETIVLLYFGGFSVLGKTIIGLHSPFIYIHSPLNFFEQLHNFLYDSFITKYVLSKAWKVHVLNPEQEKKLVDSFKLKNIVRIPNYIENAGKLSIETEKNQLRICFIGELNKRKGADILLNLILQSPSFFSFEIIGDGPLKNKFNNCVTSHVHYNGYLNQVDVNNIINSSDVLLMPSRAESFSLACLEALSYGLLVICSTDISLNGLDKYLIINKSGTISEYLSILEELFIQKKQGNLKEKRLSTSKEIRTVFSKTTLIKRLHTELFDLKSNS